jgi:Tfp pilus assembly protein PilX
MHDLPRHSSDRPAVRQRGSVLIVTLIFAAGVALSLGSFLALTLNSAKLSRQSFQANGALNLAEAGLELAFKAMNSDDYSGWSVHTATGANSRYMLVPNIDLSQGITGQIKVLIYNVTTVTRRVVAEGIATPPSGPPIRKQIEIRAKRRSIFATGLVSKDTITFSGNGVTVDSWNSNPIAPSTDPTQYSSAVKNDKGSVASTAVTISVGNADIWGYVATGRDQPEVGANGTIADYSDPVGTKDPDRITTDFKHNFEEVDVPVPISYNTIDYTIGSTDEPVPLTLPRGGDVTWEGKYYYKFPGVDIGGAVANVLTISDDVVFLPTAGSGATAIAVDGNASIRVNSGATLEIYTEGDVLIAGNGIVNSATSGTTADKLATAQQPETLQIYGTNTSDLGQTISISGNGVLSAVGYAPNADLTITGGGTNGHVLGSFVAKTIAITGGNSFHYDESLKDFGDGNPFELQSWIELFGSARITF